MMGTNIRTGDKFNAMRGAAWAFAALAMLTFAAAPAMAQSNGQSGDTYKEDEIVKEAGDFFGAVSEGLADAV
ncbi:MAG: hypothetical protein JJ937_16000, partial [Parvibaculum sp.]|nr:hypothetical protein [Parvibaculum sp.]